MKNHCGGAHTQNQLDNISKTLLELNIRRSMNDLCTLLTNEPYAEREITIWEEDRATNTLMI